MTGIFTQKSLTQYIFLYIRISHIISLLVSDICAPKICEGFVYKHTESIENVQQ